MDLTRYVCLVATRAQSIPKATPSRWTMGNVVGGRPILYVDTPVGRSARSRPPSWHRAAPSGSALTQQRSDRAASLFVDGLTDFDNLFGVDFSREGAAR